MRRFTFSSVACLAPGMLVALAACRPTAPTPAAIPSNPAEFNVSGAGGGNEISYRVRNDVRGVTRYVHASPEQAWKALIVTYNDLDIPPTTLDTASLQISSSDVRAPRKLAGEALHASFDCGRGLSGPRADSYDVAFTLTTTILPAGGDSAGVFTTLSGRARSREGASGVPVDCVSTGKLEQRIASAVSAKLAR